MEGISAISGLVGNGKPKHLFFVSRQSNAAPRTGDGDSLENALKRLGIQAEVIYVDGDPSKQVLTLINY